MSGTDSIVLVSGFGTHNVAVTATSLSGDTVCGSLPDLTVVGADGTTKCTGTKTTLTTCSFTILEGDLSVPGTHYSAMIELYGVSAAQTIPVTYNGMYIEHCTSKTSIPLLWSRLGLTITFIIISPDESRGILDSGPLHCRRRRRNFLVYAITQKQISIFFSNLVHILRVPKGRSLF